MLSNGSPRQLSRSHHQQLYVLMDRQQAQGYNADVTRSTNGANFAHLLY